MVFDELVFLFATINKPQVIDYNCLDSQFHFGFLNDQQGFSPPNHVLHSPTPSPSHTLTSLVNFAQFNPFLAFSVGLSNSDQIPNLAQVPPIPESLHNPLRSLPSGLITSTPLVPQTKTTNAKNKIFKRYNPINLASLVSLSL